MLPNGGFRLRMAGQPPGKITKVVDYLELTYRLGVSFCMAGYLMKRFHRGKFIGWMDRFIRSDWEHPLSLRTARPFVPSFTLRKGSKCFQQFQGQI